MTSIGWFSWLFEIKLLYMQPQEIKAPIPFNTVYKILLQ